MGVHEQVKEHGVGEEPASGLVQLLPRRVAGRHGRAVGLILAVYVCRLVLTQALEHHPRRLLRGYPDRRLSPLRDVQIATDSLERIGGHKTLTPAAEDAEELGPNRGDHFAPRVGRRGGDEFQRLPQGLLGLLALVEGVEHQHQPAVLSDLVLAPALVQEFEQVVKGGKSGIPRVAFRGPRAVHAHGLDPYAHPLGQVVEQVSSRGQVEGIPANEEH